MPDHHLPLAAFVKRFGVDGVRESYPVPVEQMLTRAKVKIHHIVNRSRNGVELIENDAGLTLNINSSSKRPMRSAERRVLVAQVFGLMLSGQPGPKWELYDTDMGLNAHDPHRVFAYRFAADLLIPESELRDLLRPRIPLVMREAWVLVSTHFDVPMFYATQAVTRLKYRVESS